MEIFENIETFGVIFDWDGVVVDSSMMHEKSWEWLAKEENLSLEPDHFHKGFGRKNEWIIPNLLKWSADKNEIHRLSLRKELLYRNIVSEKGIDLLPGVRVLLQMLMDNHIPASIGSSTHLENIELILNMHGLRKYFKGIVSAFDVSEGKPHPDVFLKSARIIHLPPAKCVVIEDTQVGITAAINGGFKSIGVGTTHPLELLSNASLTLPDLTYLNRDVLFALFKKSLA